MNRTLVRTVCSAVLWLCAAATVLHGAETVFVERFEGGSGKRWNIDTTLDPPGLWWHREGEEPGFHFKSARGWCALRPHARANSSPRGATRRGRRRDGRRRRIRREHDVLPRRQGRRSRRSHGPVACPPACPGRRDWTCGADRTHGRGGVHGPAPVRLRSAAGSPPATADST